MASSGPLGFGQVLGENLSPGMFRKGIPDMREVTAYHGTAGDFDAFDPLKRGTATGARSAKSATWFTEDAKTAGAYSVHAAEDAPIHAALAEADAWEKMAQKTGDNSYWDKYDEAVRKAEALDTYDARAQRRAANAKVKKVDIPDDMDLLVVDAQGMTPQDLAEAGDIDSFLNAKVREAKRSGKAGVKFLNLDDAAGLSNQPATHYALFDTSRVKMLDK
jgi:hypothetical protein